MALLSGCKGEGNDEPVPDISTSIQWELDYLDLSAEGGTEEIGLDAETDWKVITPPDSWLTISPDEGKAGKSLALTLSVTENGSGGKRETRLIVKATSGTAADTLTIRQAGVSRYVAIDWEEEARLARFDAASGEVQINFSDEAPTFTPEVSSIVVPTDSTYHIRVIKGVEVSGNSVTLRTEPGDLTDIFMDQEFSLSISPNPDARTTRSGRLNTTDRNGVIHPDKIVALMGDGRQIQLYDATSESQNIPVSLWQGTIDYSDSTLLKRGSLRLFWERCVMSANLGANLFFSFNSEEKSLGGIQFKTGRLDNFYFFLDGNLMMDLKLAIEAASRASESLSRTLLNNFIALYVPFTIGPVPLSVVIYADLMLDTSFEAEAKASLSTGFSTDIGLKAGVNYVNGAVAPIFEPRGRFTPYPPTLAVLGSADIKAAIYPNIQVRFNNLAGPNIAYKPYLGADEAVGAALSTDPAANYLGWRMGLYNQGELSGSLSLEFIGEHTSKPVEWTGDKSYIMRTPAKIERVSPEEDGQVFAAGEPIEVRFRVTGEDVTGTPPATAKALVRVEANGGRTDRTFYHTDSEGEILVSFIPTKEGDNIKASVVDENGEAISSSSFTPRLDEPSIVGIWEFEGGHSVFDMDHNLEAEVRWTNKLRFNADGTYTYTENPTRIPLEWTHEGQAYVSLTYAECKGTYTFSESERRLVLRPLSVDDQSTSQGNPIPGLISHVRELFGKAGSYPAVIKEDGSAPTEIAPGMIGDATGRPTLWIKFFDPQVGERFIGAYRSGS